MSQRARYSDSRLDNDIRDINQNISSLNASVGDIKPFFFSDGVANATELDTPANWFICNGKQLATSEFPELFSKLGFRYGANSSSNLFNLPTLTALDTYFGWIIKGK